MLTRFVTVFNDFTAFKITGDEYILRIREIVPSDHLALVDGYISIHY